MSLWSRRFLAIAIIPVVLSLASAPAFAESYASLQAQGFKTGKLAPNKAGVLGWNVTDGKFAYFCELGVATAIVDKKSLISFTSSGRTVRLDRKVYESAIGGPDASMPNYADLKAGKLKGSEVRSCRKLK